MSLKLVDRKVRIQQKMLDWMERLIIILDGGRGSKDNTGITVAN